jgi:hypothetical protein
MTWDAATFTELAKAREIDVVVPAPGRPVVRAPIWIIAVDGNLYVRSWKGYAGRWYRRARRHGTGSIVAAGGEHAVRFEPAGGSDLDAAIDRAYLRKYRYSPYARAMTRPPAAGTTLRLEPTP